ncbi:MAG: polysaccharide deacetylase family protein, partial [Gammaproteobacteria bacterium]|nr:polysaccharide deacetylase family protein [Gammaproteobacteria bacterium]
MKLRRSSLVLAYHRVLPDDDRKTSFSHDGIITSPETFKKHMKFIKKYFSIMDITEFDRHINHNHSFPPSACLITFDDGWKDNYTHAFPVLKELQMPAVIFLPTEYIETGQLFWQEKMGHTIARLFESNDEGAREIISSFGIMRFSEWSEQKRNNGIKQFVRDLKHKPYDELLD